MLLKMTLYFTDAVIYCTIKYSLHFWAQVGMPVLTTCNWGQIFSDSVLLLPYGKKFLGQPVYQYVYIYHKSKTSLQYHNKSYLLPIWNVEWLNQSDYSSALYWNFKNEYSSIIFEQE